jgi:putative transposase
VVSPQAKREAMHELIAQGFSQRRACSLLFFDRSVGRYKAKPKDNQHLKSKIISIAHERKRFGYRRIHIMMKREGYKVNHKKIYRLYKEIGLKIRRRGC